MSTATHHAISDRQFAPYLSTKDPRRAPVPGVSWGGEISTSDPDYGALNGRPRGPRWGRAGNDEMED